MSVAAKIAMLRRRSENPKVGGRSTGVGRTNLWNAPAVLLLASRRLPTFHRVVGRT